MSARGIECLVQLLKSEDEAVRILSASLIASLAHTRAGIPNGLVIAGIVHLEHILLRHMCIDWWCNACFSIARIPISLVRIHQGRSY